MLFREEDEDLGVLPFVDRAEAGRVLASKLSGSLQPPAAALSEWKQAKSSAWQSRNCFWRCHSGIRISARLAMKMCGRCSTEVPLRYPALLELVSTSA